MKADKILQTELLDIIFENRNKQYGAYVLRQNENKHLFRGMLLVLLVVILMIALYGFTNNTKTTKSLLPMETVLYQATQTKTNEKEPEPIQPPKKETPKVNTQAFTSTIKIVDTKFVSSLAKNLDSVQIGSTTTTVLTSGPVLVGTPSGTDSALGKVKVVLATKTNEVKRTADIMPSFPGGMESLRKFLKNNLEYPRELESNEEIEVKIQFVVGYDGKLKGFEVIEDGGKIFNDEVIRVLKEMPDWTPGKSNGENVSVYFSIPVKFISENQ